MEADASYSKSEQNPDGEGFDGADIGYGGTLGFDMGVRVVGDSSDHLPEMSTYGPNGDTSRYLDPTIIGSHVLVRLAQENSDTIKQARFKLTWGEDDLKVDAGALLPGRQLHPAEPAILSPITSGRRTRVTAPCRGVPRACSSPPTSTGAGSIPRGSFPGSGAPARCRRSCSCTPRTICTATSKASAIRRPRRFPGSTTAAAITRARSTLRWIRAASRTSPRRPGPLS